MEFGLLVVLVIVFVIGALLVIGHLAPGTGAQQVDWKPTRSYETEVQLELDDMEQMLEAQNARRRRSGRPELSEDDVALQVQADERDRRERAAQYRSQSS